MIPSKIIGKASGENWIGLIDATYGIVLTLLVIELPIIVIENITASRGHPAAHIETLSAIAVCLVGYFSVFTIVYDIWSYHKALLSDAIKLRMFALATGWLLFTSSLVPPCYYLVNHFATEIILHNGSDLQEAHNYLINARQMLFILVGLLYLVLAVMAAVEWKQTGQSKDKCLDLEVLFGTAASKFLVTMALLLIVDSKTFYIPPPLPVLLLATLTYLHFDVFTVWPLRRFKRRCLGLNRRHLQP